ncbi:MAG: hypothetical protein ABUS79_08125 [Pseudomonadota bacterium]
MTFKSQVASIASGIEHGAEDLPERVKSVGRAFSEWGTGARRLARKNPGLVMVGAFGIGFLLAKVARHA